MGCGSMRVVMGSDGEGKVGRKRLDFGSYLEEWGVGCNPGCSDEARGDKVGR